MTTKIIEPDDFVVGIGPTAAPTNRLPSKHEFKPWHKPRKHWIRKHQWCAETVNLIKQIKMRDNKVLTYLSLPGPDMLDIRAIHDECVKLGYSVKYLGFNDPSDESNNEQTELNISRNELANLAGIHPDSLVVPDRFEAIASTEKVAVAFQHLKSFGSFDVVNLDLCNSVAAHIPLERQETYFSAMTALIEHQSLNRTDPWLLFVTTRVDANTIHPKALRGLLNCVKANVQQHPAFRDGLKSELGLEAATINSAVNGDIKLKPKELYNAFTLAFGKWMLGFLSSNPPFWTIDMLGSWAYHVSNSNSATPDMVSLAFKCMPVVKPKMDHFKLGQNHHEAVDQASASEREAAIKLIPMVKAVRNIDTRLAKDIGELKTTIADAARFMELARYDRDAYIKKFSPT